MFGQKSPFKFVHFLVLSLWKMEIENRSLTPAPFTPGPPAMALHDAPNIREADSGSFKFIRGVEALKYAKKLIRVFHIKSGAVVPNKENRFAACVRGGAHFNHRFITLA